MGLVTLKLSIPIKHFLGGFYMDTNTIALIINGFINSLQPFHILLMIGGLFGGIIIGSLPGLSATMAVSIMLPFTFVMEPASGLIMLGAIWCGGVYGGANAAILLNIPGTASSIATTFDGYPMTKKGEGDKALLTSLVSSAFGGVFGVIILLTAFAPLAVFSLMFGKPEYFWLTIFGLTTISAMSIGNARKGLLAGALGLLISTIGLDPLSGAARFTFNYSPLMGGVSVVPALIGIFAFSQILELSESNNKQSTNYKRTDNLIKKVMGELWKKCRGVLIRSSFIGTIVGMLPGAGGDVASLIAYNEAKRWDKKPQRYGKGAIEGVAASESSNNAMIGGALIPMMSLGIPGAPVAAVIMGGLLAHGIIPGSKLLSESGDIAYTFITSLVIANILMVVVGYFMLRIMTNILRVPNYFIIPGIFFLSTIGAYAFRNSLTDVYIMIGMGIIAYLLSKAGVSAGPLALGLVLGPISEEALGVSLVLAQAKNSIVEVMFLRPVSIILIILIILSLFTPLITQYFKNKKKMKLEELE